jgi:exopolyphosphatase/guanosine-5'-triphosphate,3'-diphosphate pyrophosphatase
MQKHKIAAVIDIGSSFVRMHISQWNSDTITELDILEKPLQIGKEVFSGGSISSDTVGVLSKTLAGFCEKAREYGIKSAQVHTIATTALREAANREYIADYIATRNKLHINILEDGEAGSLLAGALKNNTRGLKSDAPLIIYGGSGTVDFELLKGTQTVLAHSIQTGLLKIAEMIRETSEFSRYPEIMAEEYLNTYLSRKNRMEDLLKADSIVFGAGDLTALSKFFKAGSSENFKISSAKLKEVYETSSALTFAQTCREHSLTAAQGESLFAMMTLLTAFLKHIDTDEIHCARITHGGAVLDSILRDGARKTHGERLHVGALSSAYDLATRYYCDINHADCVSGCALTLLKALSGIFPVSKKQSLLLQIACILHETGHFTNSKNSRKSAFHLIKDVQIYGLSEHETLLIANIISPRSFADSGVSVRKSPRKTAGEFTKEEVLFVSKMHALARIADALDYSHKQKGVISSVTLDIESESLEIALELKEDYTLEQWTFNHRKDLFRRVFGITPKLRIDNIYE